MIQITLYDRVGSPFQVGPHPNHVDFAENDGKEKTMESSVSFAPENAIGSFIVRLHALSSRDTLEHLKTILTSVKAAAPDREDGIRLCALLVSWADQWRGGTWEIGGNAYEVETLKAKPTAEIDLSRRARVGMSVTVTDPNALYEAPLGYGDRMATADELARESGVPAKERDTINAWILQRESKIKTYGSGSKGRSREKKPMSGPERAARQRRMMQEDGLGGRSEFVGARVSIDAKTLIEKQDAKPGEMLETIAVAILSGLTWDEAKARLLKKPA